jgi:anti-sigma regulatory factor (Ser/Thr protein kinase)
MSHLSLIELPADRACPRAARQFAKDAADACGVDSHAVSLCVSEAVTNAVIHGYRAASDPGTVAVAIRTCDEGLEVSVSDDGVGLSPRADSPGAGLGMPLIAAMADQMHIEAGTTGTRVVMRFAA